MRQQLYLKLLELLYQAQVGHIGSCLSCLDIIINTLTLQMKPQDKFILSKGHAAPSLYVVLNYLKIITDEQLKSFNQEGTKFGIHPSFYLPNYNPFPTGSLGHGLSLACGLAYGERLNSQNKTVPRIQKNFSFVNIGLSCNNI